MPDEDRKDFFISYNQADKAWAEWIAWELEAAGHTTIIQAWDFPPGGNFVLEMHQAAKEARRTIAVLSPDYLTSRFTQPEWAAAFAQDPTGAKGILVPVRVREVDLEGLLGQIIYLNLIGLDEEASRNALISGIEQRRAKPSSAPKFPGAARPKEAPRFPGSIWNVPHPRNPNFTGREQLLKDLRALLTAGQAAALTQAALHGLGGIGKTQLALEYAYRHARDYDLVWWVRSESPAALAADYAALAVPLDLPEKEAKEQEAAVAAVRRYLEQGSKWLLIFDNAAEPKDLHNYIPHGGGGQILITSRHTAWGGTAKPLKVQVWPREEAVAFLLRRTGQEDEAAAGELAKELGDLPLALEQAGAYIEATNIYLKTYLKLVQNRRRELWQDEAAPLDYGKTVAATWSLALDKIKAEAPVAEDFFNLCSFLAPQDIPLPLLTKAYEEVGSISSPLASIPGLSDKLPGFSQDDFPEEIQQLVRHEEMPTLMDALWQIMEPMVQEANLQMGLDASSEGNQQDVQAGGLLTDLKSLLGDPLSLNRTLLPLMRYSLIERVEDSLTVHRLVQAVVRDRLNDESKKKWASTAVELVNAAFSFNSDDMRNWPVCAQLLPHALAATGHAATLGVKLEVVGRLLNQAGLYLQGRAEFRQAKSLFERGITIVEAIYGPEHPEMAIRVSNLGSVLRDLGDLAGAKKCFERALHIGEASGPDHPSLATRLNNLADVLYALGDLSGAISLLERVLAIDESVYGRDHSEVATDLNNLGCVLQAQGKMAEARSHYEQALSIYVKILSPNHHLLGVGHSNLGRVLNALGDLAEARYHLERGLAISEAAYGPNHPAVATDVNNLGSVLKDLGDLEGAKSHYERALNICERILGPSHPMVATAANNLGQVLQELGDLTGARMHYERALAIDEEAFGPNHLQVAFPLNSLGVLLKAQGDLEGAKAHFKRALKIFRKFLGDDHHDSKLVEKNLAFLSSLKKNVS